MSTIKKPMGIIYRAYNTISGKSYIGQTTRTLSIRKKEHLSKANRQQNYKFVNALSYYPEISWEWSILAEVEVEKLNEYELFFIKELDTFNNGYNSALNSYKPCRSKSSNDIYKLYHADYGLVVGTRQKFREIDPDISHYLTKLLSGRFKSVKGWVLAENKNKYDEIIGKISLVHSVEGRHCLKLSEFKERFNLTTNGISQLKTGTIKSHRGWKLVEES